MVSSSDANEKLNPTQSRFEGTVGLLKS